jgi:hypothetical protein
MGDYNNSVDDQTIQQLEQIVNDLSSRVEQLYALVENLRERVSNAGW